MGLCCLLGASLAVHAQDSLRLELSLEEAQQYALENNRTLKNASIDVLKAQATHWQSISSMLPQISAKADYSDYCGYEMNFGMMSIPMNPYGTLGVTASMAFSGAQVVAVQISKIAQRMSDISLKMSEQETMDQVKTLYYSALVMEQTVELLHRNLDNMKELYKYTEESVKVGIAEQTDADQLLIQLSTMRTGIYSSATSLEMVYNSLRLQLGVDVNTEILAVIAFIVTFILFVVLIRFLGHIISKLVEAIHLGIFDKIGGFLFGVMKGALITSIIIMIMNVFGLTNLIDINTRKESVLYTYTESIANMLYKNHDIVKESMSETLNKNVKTMEIL